MIRSGRPILFLLSLFGMLAMSSACSISKARQIAMERDEAMALDAGTDAVPVSADVSTNMGDLTKSPDSDPEEEAAPEPKPDPEHTPRPTREPASAQTPTPESGTTGEAKKNDEPEKDTPNPPKAALTSYTVKRGDTLMKISFNLYADLYRWKEIFALNRSKMTGGHERLSPGTHLRVYRPGTVVIRRNGEPYLIRRRDTLSKISSSVYGTSAQWRKIWKNNPQLIHDPNRIYAGFYLYYTLDVEERKSRRLASESEHSLTAGSHAPEAPTNPSTSRAPSASTPPDAPVAPGSPAPEPAPRARHAFKPMVPPPTPPLSQFIGTPNPAQVPPTAPVSAN